MDYYRRGDDGNVVGIEKLVFMREDDFSKMLVAMNVASLLVFAGDGSNKFFNLDGDLLAPEEIERLKTLIEDGHYALGNARYVGDGLPTLHAILFAH